MKHKKILSGFLSTACIFSAVTNQNINLKTKAVILSKDIINNEVKDFLNQIQSEGKIDKEYSYNVLNLQNPYFYLNSDITQDFRFFDGNKEQIDFDENGNWRPGDDNGKGSVNVLRTLFPSCAGTLNTESSYSRVHNFSLDLADQLTSERGPKLIAKLIGVCYKYRYDENFKNKVNFLIQSFENNKKISYQKIDSAIFGAKEITDFKTRLSVQANRACNGLNFDEKIQEIQVLIKDLSKNKDFNKDEKVIFSNQCSILKNTKTSNCTDKTLMILNVISALKKCVSPKQQCAKENKKLLELQKYMDVKIEVTADEQKELLLLKGQGCISDNDIEALKIGDFAAVKKVLNSRDRFNQNDQGFANEIKTFFSQELGATNFSNKSFATVLNLILNMFYMIKNQEQKDSNDTSKIIPKFTCEKMLMSFFVKKFNGEDIKFFYQQILDDSRNYPNKVYSAFSEEEKTEIKDIDDFLGKTNQNKFLSPYAASLCEHAKRIPALNLKRDQNIVSFDPEKGFADCVETAIMHTLNILLYSRESNWSFLDKLSLKYTDENMLKTFKEKCEGYQPLQYLPLKNRLCMFYTYMMDRTTSETGRPCIDNFAASIPCKASWNYVISNMHEPEMGGMYPLLYCAARPGHPSYCLGNELESDFLNFLKFIYNTAFVLEKELGISSDALADAKKNLDNLTQKIGSSTEFVKEEIENATLKIYGLINPKVKKVELSGFHKRNNKVLLCTELNVITGEDYRCFKFKNSILENHSRTACDTNLEFLKNTSYVKSELANIFLAKIEGREPTMCYGNDIMTFEKFHSGLYYKDFEKDSNREYFFKSKFLKSIAEQNLANVDATILTRFLTKDSSISKDENYFKVVGGEKALTALKEKISKVYSIKSIEEKEKVCSTLMKAYSEKKIDENSIEKIVGEDWVISEKMHNENLYIPKSAKNLTIMEHAFSYSKIECLRIPENIKKIKIEKSAFERCSALKKIIFPKAMDSLEISHAAFNETNDLKEIEFPEIIKENLTIEPFNFGFCKLNKITFPKAVANLKIDDYVFSNNDELTNVEFPETIGGLEIGNDTFSSNKLKEVKFPKFVENFTLGTWAFSYNKWLTNIEFPEVINSNFTLGSQSFGKCENLEKIIFPKITKEFKMDRSAFEGCSCENLKQVVFPETVYGKLVIKEKAFGGCKNLEQAVFSRVTGDLILDQSFFENLKEVKFNDHVENLIIQPNDKKLRGLLLTFDRNSTEDTYDDNDVNFYGDIKNLTCSYQMLERIKFQKAKKIANARITRGSDRVKNPKRIEFPGNIQNLVVERNIFHDSYKNVEEIEFLDGIERISFEVDTIPEYSKLAKITVPRYLKTLSIEPEELFNIIETRKSPFTNFLDKIKSYF